MKSKQTNIRKILTAFRVWTGLGITLTFFALSLSCWCVTAQQSPMPDDGQLVVKANSLLKQGKLDEAQQAVQQAIRLNATNYEGYAVAAKIASKQGDSAGANNFIQKALEFAPDEDKDKVRELAEQIQSAASSSSTALQAPSTANSLTDRDRLTLNTLMLLLDQADQAATSDDRNKAFSDFLDRSADFAKAHSEQTNIWIMRAVAAIDLNRPHEAWEAGQHLKSLGLMHSDDPKLGKVFAELDLKGWLDKEPENIERKYGDGYSVYKFGMTPSEVASAANMNINTSWDKLPVAGEFAGLDVRYFWQYLRKDQNIPRINGGNYSDSSYICFLFKDGKLFKISIRLMNDNQYQSYENIFNQVVASTEAVTQQIQNVTFFRIYSPKVILDATSSSQGTFFNYIKNGSPLSNVDLPTSADNSGSQQRQHQQQEAAEREQQLQSSTSNNGGPQNGYYYTLADGNTLSAIAKAYRAHGINVTVDEILIQTA